MRDSFHISGLLNLLVIFILTGIASAQWTSSTYPDLRGPTAALCQVPKVPTHNIFLCDPDSVLNSSQAHSLNEDLKSLALNTPCHCQRRSQCATGTGADAALHGFVVSIAIVKNLQMTIHSPSELQLNERAESFCRTLEGRWALGDCGNSVILFVWEHYKKMVIWPARLAEKYVTVEERRRILQDVNDLVQSDHWHQALSQVIQALHNELNGLPEDRVDTGTLSLIVAVAVACILTMLITCCVCAIRCCGNLSGSVESGGARGAVARRADSIRTSVIRRGSQLRRSLSRSPKFPVRGGESNNQRVFSDTTIV